MSLHGYNIEEKKIPINLARTIDEIHTELEE